MRVHFKAMESYGAGSTASDTATRPSVLHQTAIVVLHAEGWSRVSLLFSWRPVGVGDAMVAVVVPPRSPLASQVNVGNVLMLRRA